MSVFEFISKNIDKTTKLSKDYSHQETLIELPFPYTTPCIKDAFQEMYYWDTYFTQKSLYCLGRNEQAKNNILNFCYLVEKYGKIPNGNRTYFLTRSQPPFFGLMIEDYLNANSEDIPIERLYKALEKEYLFWQTKRCTGNGLNGYNCDYTDDECKEHLDYVTLYNNRTGSNIKETIENSRHVQAECESGWDFTPRFMGECANYNPVDLNSLLYKDEIILSKLARSLGDKKVSQEYIDKANKRAENMKVMIKDGLYYDYNYKNNTLSPVVSCASLYPFFVGLDNNKDNLKKLVLILERDYGLIASCSNLNSFQWSEPNSWAPLNYIAVKALHDNGLKDIAKRIANKYIDTLDKIYKETKGLWEKYNGYKGNLEVSSEYGTPEMLGWTAGVYSSLFNYKESNYTNII